ARADGLSAIGAIIEHNFVLALELLERAEQRIRASRLGLWPTWSLLRGISRFCSGDYRGSAREFLADGAPGRGNALLPLLLAIHSLRAAGTHISDDLSQGFERPFLTFTERKRLEEALQATLAPEPTFAANRASRTGAS